jgi:preprotein translocase subunit SecD
MVAQVPPGYSVVYNPNSCEPSVDARGAVLMRSQDGAEEHVAPYYSASGFNVNGIVWTPARGDLNGVSTTMTASLLKSDAEVLTMPVTDRPAVVANTTADGASVLASITSRITGLPMATFIAGEPLRGGDSRILAPTIQSVISDSVLITGLSQADAERIAGLINTSALR